MVVVAYFDDRYHVSPLTPLGVRLEGEVLDQYIQHYNLPEPEFYPVAPDLDPFSGPGREWIELLIQRVAEDLSFWWVELAVVLWDGKVPTVVFFDGQGRVVDPLTLGVTTLKDGKLVTTY